VRHQADMYLADCGIGEDASKGARRNMPPVIPRHDTAGARARGERGQRVAQACLAV
jgi:hypothetical protein